jgi:hypothetical protein
MNWTLRKYIGHICYVYIDDIVIFSDSLKEHCRNVHLVLEELREAGIIMSVRESHLFADEIEFLGHVVSSKGLEVGAAKVEKILDWPVPHNHTKSGHLMVSSIMLPSSYPPSLNTPPRCPTLRSKVSSLFG